MWSLAPHGAPLTTGRLTLTGVAPGTLTVQADGFLPASVVLTDPMPLSLDVTLEPVPNLEEEVVADATRTATRLADQPLRVEVVDAEEIEEKALMTPGSVAMLLAETTGLRVQTTAPSLGAANVRVNGLRGRYTQLLADGLPLYGTQGDSLSLLQVPPLDLGRVEIIKGAASALYGPTALGGVVNLVARRPVRRRSGHAAQRHVAGRRRRDGVSRAPASRAAGGGRCLGGTTHSAPAIWTTTAGATCPSTPEASCARACSTTTAAGEPCLRQSAQARRTGRAARCGTPPHPTASRSSRRWTPAVRTAAWWAAG